MVPLLRGFLVFVGQERRVQKSLMPHVMPNTILTVYGPRNVLVTGISLSAS